MLWDIFCKVIDNFGDIGVCWRLSTNLAQRGQKVRLWIDDASALDWMAPGARQGLWEGISVHPWSESCNKETVIRLSLADVWIEGFGCEIAPEFIAHYAHSVGEGAQKDYQAPIWINLEYLSAEDYVESSHGLPSPVMHGPGKGWCKYFFYPGFTEKTGGLLREIDYSEQQNAWDRNARKAWMRGHGVAWDGEKLISLFCYEPDALQKLLNELVQAPEPVLLLATHGRASCAVKNAMNALELDPSNTQLTIHPLPELTQIDYDRLLWTCDFNFVRGEDSLVRALWAGKPFVWHIYPQEDGAHLTKLDAFLDQINAADSLRNAHHLWNSRANSQESRYPCDLLPWPELGQWQTTVAKARTQLSKQPDQCSQLIQFVEKKR